MEAETNFKFKNRRKSGKRKESTLEADDSNECLAKPKAAKWHRLSADLSTPDLLMQEKYQAHVHKLREEFTKKK